MASEPVPYMQRTREYYEAQGFEKAYKYAHFEDTPFTPLPKPLKECVLGLVTTASTYRRANLEPRKIDSGSTTTPPDKLYTDDLSWDKQATHTDDLNTFCPISHLQALATQNVIGGLTANFHCAPTEYSHRITLEKDAPELLRRLTEDGADIALLVPLWPVCHQTVSLTARYLEAHGMPTVLIGSAKDIVEHCGVPRFLFVDFPLGNPCGKPWDTDMQRRIVSLGLSMFETAQTPMTTVHADEDWGDQAWRTRFLQVTDANRHELAEKGEDLRRRRAQRVHRD